MFLLFFACESELELIIKYTFWITHIQPYINQMPLISFNNMLFKLNLNFTRGNSLPVQEMNEYIDSHKLSWEKNGKGGWKDFFCRVFHSILWSTIVFMNFIRKQSLEIKYLHRLFFLNTRLLNKRRDKKPDFIPFLWVGRRSFSNIKKL
jgi:hypothetical protein